MWKAEGAFRSRFLFHHYNRDHFTGSFPPVTLMFIFLPAHLDLTNSSHFSSWHRLSLRDASDGNCTELPRSAGNQFFTPPNSSPQIQDEEYGLSPFLLNVVFFSFCSTYIYISCPDKWKWSFSKINNIIFAEPYSTPWQLIISQLNLLLIGNCSALIFCYLFTEDQNA